MNITNSIFHNKALVIVIAVLLVLVELEIFFIFSAKSGKKYILQVLNDSGTVIYEIDGNHLTKFKKYYFEATFGPFENYQKSWSPGQCRFRSGPGLPWPSACL